MEFQEVLYKRRSVRAFKPDKLTREQIDTLLRCAMSGPSAINSMPWEFFAVVNDELREKIRKSAEYANYESPLIVIVAGNMKRALPSPVRDFWIQDCSAAIENLLLAATDMGLGSCWCGLYPKAEAVAATRALLGQPEEIVPLALIHIGYAQESPEPRTQYKPEFAHIIE